MSKSVCALAMLAAMGAVTTALAQSGESAYSAQSYFSGFEYRPLSVQIEGGATFLEGMQSQSLHSGENIGLGLTWRPTSRLPLALRIDGMYQDFHDRRALLEQEAAALGTAVDWGKTRMWGGDADAELDTLLSPRVRLYFLAGAGWYDTRESFYQHGIVEGVFCGWYYCFTGPALVSFRVAETDTGMKFEKNAGVGLEFSLGQGATLFFDARYVRFEQGGQKRDFVPVRMGLRF